MSSTTQLSLSRQVALKVVAPDLAGEEEFRSRFLREARVAASLDHPHVLPVYEAGEADAVLYLAMRFVEGESLAQLLARECALEPARALSIVTQIPEALAAAHAAGLVHRDLKPANVLLARAGAREHAYLCDFGLARRAQGVTELTKAGGFVGSVLYAAPRADPGRHCRSAHGRLRPWLPPVRVPDGRAPLSERTRGCGPMGPPPRPRARSERHQSFGRRVLRRHRRARPRQRPSERFASAGAYAQALTHARESRNAGPGRESRAFLLAGVG